MKTILFIIQKEFKQIFRNKAMLPLIFVLPIIQIVLLSYAATFEVTNIKWAYIDNDKSGYSRELISKINASSYFNTQGELANAKQGFDAVQKGKIALFIEIPPYFEKQLIKEKKASLSIQIDAINGATAGVENAYINQIIQSFNAKIRTELMPVIPQNVGMKRIEMTPSYWYNPALDYKTFMVPGIIVLLVTMITFFLSGMNIVREKEIGTLEQINVTPIKKYQFIIGKLMPFWILGIFILFFGMNIGRLLFDVPLLGNPFVILVFAAIYILVFLGMGFLISNFTDTQQQAMFIAWFFVVIFILMSGLFTPIESMPPWAQKMTEFNPIRYFIEVIRMVMLKGSGFKDVLPQLIKIGIYALVMNILAVASYRKTA
ncbi:MAG: ABC transporter permease [Flavobacteriaceae bacterium]